MHTGVFWQTVYWLSSPVLAILAVILLVRRLQRSYPVFFVYIVVLFLIDITRLLAFRGSGMGIAYFYVYWISDAVGTLLALLTIGELVVRRLFPKFYKLRFYRYLFFFAAVFIFISTALTAYSSKPAVRLSALLTVLHTSDFLVTVMLLFFVGLMAFMGRRWGQYEFGIALGLGINVAALLATFAIFSKSLYLHGIIRTLPGIAEDLASLVWLVTFLRPERPLPAVAAPVSPEVLQEAKKWEETLKGSLSKKKDPS